MEIKKAVHAGYCWGVERALDIVEETAERLAGKETVRTLGPVIHNPSVVADLERKGVASIDSLDELAAGTVIVRTHGVGPEVYEEARKKGLNLVDATCPLVTLVHNRARQLVEEGYHLMIFGSARHPEVIGTLGQAGVAATVIEKVEDVARLNVPKRVGLVVQTTQELERLGEVIAQLAPRCRELKVFNTICNPTIERQEAARELARESEVVIVVGGRESSNTRHLAEVCREEGARAYHIENPIELEKDWVAGVERIGVTAGASTPGWLMDEVIGRLKDLAAP